MGAYSCHISKGSRVLDHFTTSSPLLASARSITSQERCLEPALCSLTPMLYVQAETLVCARAPCVHDELAEVKAHKMGYRAEKVIPYREALKLLLHPASPILPQDDCWYATALQSCIAQAAFAVFGRPSNDACPKVRQSWLMKNAKWHVPQCSI